MNGDVFIYIYTSRGIYLFSRSLVERSVFNAVSAESERFHIRCFFAARAIACFLLLLFHVLAFGGEKEPPLASRASIPYFLCYRGSISPILRIEFFVNFLRVVERHRC